MVTQINLAKLTMVDMVIQRVAAIDTDKHQINYLTFGDQNVNITEINIIHHNADLAGVDGEET